MGPQNPLGALGDMWWGVGGCQDSHRKPEDFQTSGTNLNFNGNDHRDELLVQLSQHHQLLQRQTAEPADRQTDGQTDVLRLGEVSRLAELTTTIKHHRVSCSCASEARAPFRKHLQFPTLAKTLISLARGFVPAEENSSKPGPVTGVSGQPVVGGGLTAVFRLPFQREGKAFLYVTTG